MCNSPYQSYLDLHFVYYCSPPSDCSRLLVLEIIIKNHDKTRSFLWCYLNTLNNIIIISMRHSICWGLLNILPGFYFVVVFISCVEINTNTLMIYQVISLYFQQMYK